MFFYFRQYRLTRTPAGIGRCAAQPSQKNFRPQVEPLEDRTLLSPLGIHLRQSHVTVTEGRSNVPAFQVRLTNQPASDVQVQVMITAGDKDVSLVDNLLRFSPANWDEYQSIRVSAAEDSDRFNGSAAVRFESHGLDAVTGTITERDNDKHLAIEFERQKGIQIDKVVVPEGRTAALLVRLTAAPVRKQVIQVTRVRGDKSLTVLNHSQLTFTAANWDKFQWVLFGATEDSDSRDGEALFRLSSPGLPTRIIRVVERDNDLSNRMVTSTVLVDDFTAQPLIVEQQGNQEFSYYNRLGGDRGEVFHPGAGEVNWGPGYVEARVLQDGQFAGVFESLNQILREGRPLNLSAILPQPIVPHYQQRATAVVIEVADGIGLFKVELKSPSEELLWSRTKTLRGGTRTLRFSLPNPPPANVQMLTWIIEGQAGSFARVTRVALETVGRDLGSANSFVWPYSALLANYDPGTGLTRDRANFPAGDFDNTSASGLQALAAVVAADLGLVSRADARAIVEQTTLALLAVPRLHGLMPHFVRGKEAPQIVPGTEYSSLDSIIAWLSLVLARQSLGLPTDAVEQALRDIDWDDLRLPDGTISHGYADNGQRLSAGWDTFGTETFLVNLAFAAARPNEAIPAVPYPNPPTANGSGFIDELAWLLVPAPATDVWGNQWTNYRAQAARAQVTDPVFAEVPGPIFGLSAAEVALPWEVPSNVIYQAFGNGGQFSPRNDGTQFFGQPVAALHYAGLIATLEPQAAYSMWDFLEQRGLVTPLNAVESLYLDQDGTCLPAWNGLKGSLNLALTALGFAKARVSEANYGPYQAARDNAFIATGLARLSQ